MMKTNSLLWAAVLLALGGCSTTFDGNKVDYKAQGNQAPTLEVPPDLSLLTKSTQASVPVGGAANASTLQANSKTSALATANATAANRAGDVRVVREGTQRWLVTEQAPEKLWEELKKFWTDNGLTINLDQPELGIMETDWNENRAKLPQEGLGKYLGKVLGGLMSTNERDKYRTRIERTASGGSEIYISHRGLVEDFVDKDKSRLAWKPRPADPELEVEFLKRLMVRLGAAQDAANAALDQPKSATVVVTPPSARASIVQDATQSSLVMSDAFEQAWRRVGLSLDRTNFTVEDRDRSKGVYFVRYVESDAAKSEPGFFARMFGAKTKESLQKYQILVTAETLGTRVRVADTTGKVLNTTDAQNILKVLQSDLK
jgi:outer membrane protein assembly factor BamC